MCPTCVRSSELEQMCVMHLTVPGVPEILNLNWKLLCFHCFYFSYSTVNAPCGVQCTVTAIMHD